MPELRERESEMPEMREVATDLEKAFSEFQPLHFSQAHPLTTPILQCFNWCHIFQNQDFTGVKLYIVTFRSVRKEDADNELLYKADRFAYEEAKKSGGLLVYWGGALNSKRECISTCVWESREAAEKANLLTAHIEATKLVAQMYESYFVERYWLTATPDKLPAFELIGKPATWSYQGY